MKEEAVNRTLAVAIFIVLLIILVTPFFIQKSSPEFTHVPRLRMNYIDNKTVYDVQSELGDYIFKNMSASVSVIAGESVNRSSNDVKNAYVLTGEVSHPAFNLTIHITGNSGKSYMFMGDFNITKVYTKNRFYVFMNITEHSNAWLSRKSSVEISNMPYKTALEEFSAEGQKAIAGEAAQGMKKGECR